MSDQEISGLVIDAVTKLNLAMKAAAEAGLDVDLVEQVIQTLNGHKIWRVRATVSRKLGEA